MCSKIALRYNFIETSYLKIGLLRYMVTVYIRCTRPDYTYFRYKMQRSAHEGQNTLQYKAIAR